MNKEQFTELVKQYSNNTVYLSFIKTDHPAYLELMAAEPDRALPWALSKLHDTIDKEMDQDNNPWLLISLIRQYSNGQCFEGRPKIAGQLKELRGWILNWAEVKRIAF